MFWSKGNKGPDDLNPFEYEGGAFELLKRDNEVCDANNEPKLEVLTNQQDAVSVLNSNKKFVQKELYGSFSPTVNLEKRATLDKVSD